MAVSHEQRMLADATRSTPDQFRDCRAVARALIDTEQPLVRSLTFLPFRQPTDYELARSQSMMTIHSLITQWNGVRNGNLRADVIRAVAQLRQVEAACKACPRTNIRNLAEGKTFACKAVELNNQPGNTAFRFRLNHAGHIVRTS